MQIECVVNDLRNQVLDKKQDRYAEVNSSKENFY